LEDSFDHIQCWERPRSDLASLDRDLLHTQTASSFPYKVDGVVGLHRRETARSYLSLLPYRSKMTASEKGEGTVSVKGRERMGERKAGERSKRNLHRDGSSWNRVQSEEQEQE
jgi:hypothetical protein